MGEYIGYPVFVVPLQLPADRILEADLRLPSEDIPGLGRVEDDLGHIIAAGRDHRHIRRRYIQIIADRIEHILDAVTFSRGYIEYPGWTGITDRQGLYLAHTDMRQVIA